MNAILKEDITACLGAQPYQVEVKWRAGTLRLDEPVTLGGGDTGPDPYSALLGALAACTLSTIRMYAGRKGWPLTEACIRLNLEQTPQPLMTVISREVSLEGNLTGEQRERLLLIAGKCPLSKMLEGEILTPTTLLP